MAAVDVGELLDQVRRRLGLGDASLIRKFGKAVGDLELSASEVDRLVDAVNIELGRIYAERHMAATLHRVPHDIVETPDVDDGGKPVLDPATKKQTVTRTNQRTSCPDCGRGLVGARDGDSSVRVLICQRLHGLGLSLPDLTPNDIVACGLEG